MCGGVVLEPRLAEMLDAKKIDIDQVALGVPCQFNLRQATVLFGELPAGRHPEHQTKSGH